MLSLPCITVPTLMQYINTSMQAVIAGALVDGSVFRVSGTIGQIPRTAYPTYYGVKLSSNGISILLNVPRQLIQDHNLCGGEDVTVTGGLVVKLSPQSGSVDIRVNVSDIAVSASNAAVARTSDLATIASLKQNGMRRNAFPTSLRPRLTVISSKSVNAQVDNDFLLEIGEVSKRMDITHVRVNILSADEIKTAIHDAECDILVLIRGGGDADQFTVFDNADLVSEFSKHPAYRVVGLGHTGNSTILDFVSDFCANTPTQAGGHIRDRLFHQLQFAEKLLTHNKMLAEQIAERDAKIKALSNLHENPAPLNNIPWKRIAQVAAISFGVLAIISHFYKFA